MTTGIPSTGLPFGGSGGSDAAGALRDLDIDAVITNTPDKALEIMNA